MAPRVLGGEGISPLAIAMVRMTGAAAFFQIFTRATGLLAPTTWKDQRVLAALSLAGITLNQALFLLGLRLTTPMTAALLSVTIPVIAAVLSVATRQERASWRLGAGLGLSIAGVVWLTGVRRVDLGALVVLGNCVSYATYIVYSRETIRRLGTLTVITWLFTWGGVLFAPFGLPTLVASLPDLTQRGWLFLGYLVLVPTIIAYLCNAWALGRSTATLVTIYIYVQPVMAAVLAWLRLGQSVSDRLLGAAALIVVGVTIVATRKDASSVPVEE